MCEGVSIVARVVHRVAEDVLGAANDESVKVFIVVRVAHRVAEDVLGATMDGSVKVRRGRHGPPRAHP